LNARTDATRRKVRAAVLALLKELDYQRLTFERVASVSGVAKTTLYRHWSSKAELVFDLVLHDRELPSLADTGTPSGDVAALAHRIVVFLGAGAARQVLPGVLAEVGVDDAVGARFQELFIEPAQLEIEAVVHRVQRRSHRTSHPDVADLQAVLLGSAYMWLFVQRLSTRETESRLKALMTDLFGEVR